MTTATRLPALNGPATQNEAPTAAPIRVGDIQVMAQNVARSGLWGMTEPQAFALMLLAHAKGLHPALAVERFHVIQGKPAMKADAMLAEFQARGGRVTWHRHDNEACEATFDAPAIGEPLKVAWTMADAKRAQLTSPMWAKYPRQMLRARVISEAIRMSMPGILAGIYTPEEVSDFGTAERPEHHAANHDNGTGHGSGAYAPPATVAEFEAWLKDFVAEINAKWLDRWTDKHTGEIDPNFLEYTGKRDGLLSTYQLAGHLVKEAVADGRLNAPENGGKQRQKASFAAVLWMRDRAAVIREAEDYGRRKWREAIQGIKAIAARTVAEPESQGPATPAEDTGDDPDVDFPDEPGEREAGED